MLTRKQFQNHIEEVLNNPKTPSKLLGEGRTAYWDEAFSAVIIRNPKSKDLGTMFQPCRGKDYFDNLTSIEASVSLTLRYS